MLTSYDLLSYAVLEGLAWRVASACLFKLLGRETYPVSYTSGRRLAILADTGVLRTYGVMCRSIPSGLKAHTRISKGLNSLYTTNFVCIYIQSYYDYTFPCMQLSYFIQRNTARLCLHHCIRPCRHNISRI